MKFLTDFMARRAHITPDAPAFHSVETGQVLTYAQLDQRIGQATHLLKAKGLGPGDRLAILCRNRVEFFELLFACARIGAILVPLNWRMPATELAGLLEDCSPTLLAYGQEDADTASTCLNSDIRGLDLEQAYPAARDASPVDPGRLSWPADECWYLIYTSGTTGRPKGVIQTYGMAVINAINIGQAIGLRVGDSTLNFLPLFHTAGINLHTLPVLFNGGLVHVLPGFDADTLLGLVNTGQLDVFIGVPAVYRELSLHPRFSATDLTRVRNWACGGAPLPDNLVRTFADHGARVCNGFGMTETGPTAFLSDPDHVLTKIGSVGKAQVMINVRIAGPDDRELPQGDTGEIQFQGPGLTPGYWHRPDETEKLYTADGWLKSGDLGRMDEDGYCFVAGRIKEMYISGGENVYPAEVENILEAHPGIREAAVIGVPDEKWGEVGCACLILMDGVALDETEIRTWCRDHLAAFKVPRYVLFLDDFPRTAAGKVQKHLLPRPELVS